jgi:peptidoglycan/xylan/chitin deacetylase (PgdA/CDA1 family)
VAREQGAIRSSNRGRTLAGVSIALVLVLTVVALAQTVTGDAGPTTPSARPDNPLVSSAAAAAVPAAVAAAAVPPTTTTTTTPPATTALPPSTAGYVPVVSRVPTNDRVIFLGIDDGLVRDPAVLDFLADNAMPFTAFLQASPLQADPGYWARARTVGGTIEAHTLTHPNLTKLSADQVRRELCGSSDAITAATGVRPTLFRPPYGAYNDTVRAVASQCGYVAMVLWKGATNDGRIDLQEQVLKPGDVLLMHWRTDLLTNLRNVLALANAQGFRVARLEDYLEPLP